MSNASLLGCPLKFFATVIVSTTIVPLSLCGPASAQWINPSNKSSQTNTNNSAPDSSKMTIRQNIDRLNWIRGPVSLNLIGNVSFKIPDGYKMLMPPDSAEFIRLNGNPTTKSDDRDYILMARGGNDGWFAALYYENVGHVEDNQKINTKKLLELMEKSNEQDNIERQKEGFPAFKLIGWAVEPNYDPKTNRLEWAFEFQTSDGAKTINLNTRVLGRTGDMHVILVDSVPNLVYDMPNFNAALTGLSFDPGHRYADYKEGDKLARYGLMGLIAGGATAAAVKTGLLAGLFGLIAVSGKAVIVGVLALLAGLRAFFVKLFRKK